MDRLTARTEGWIAGLHLAALSLQGQPDPAPFIAAFSGSHRFILDYLLEEVVQQQPPAVQAFLQATALLDRLCGPLCDAVLLTPPGTGQTQLEGLERANLFLLPLDDQRHWYRYHALFADLLRQRQPQGPFHDPRELPSAVRRAADGAPEPEQPPSAVEVHRRASGWYEEQGLALEAFGHAVAAGDIDRAARLVEGRGMPLHFRGAVTPVLDWLASLPAGELDARPVLWVRYASLLLVIGHPSGVEEKLQAAEAALEGAQLDDATMRSLIGQIAGARATVALTRYQADAMMAQSRRALEYLPPEHLASRATAFWTLGYACILQGDRNAAGEAFTDAITLGQASGDAFTTLLATIGLGNAQELDNQLTRAAETYQRAVQLSGEHPLSIAYEAYLGLARIYYEWNDLEAARVFGEESLHLARQYESVIDRYVVCQMFLARLKLAQGDESAAAALVAEAERAVRQRHFALRLPEVADAEVQLALHQSRLVAAARRADAFDLPLSRARVRLAEGNPVATLAVLAPWKVAVEERGWVDERLKVLVLEAVAREHLGSTDEAVETLLEALALAEPGGNIRIFLDAGAPMGQLLAMVAARGMMPAFVARLREAWALEQQIKADGASPPGSGMQTEPLSRREVEVLRLIAQGLSNQEISEQLFLALSTVKRHNRNIFDKLQVQRRTEAVARAREQGLL